MRHALRRLVGRPARSVILIALRPALRAARVDPIVALRSE